MSEDFKVLTRENINSGKLPSGKIIKGKSVKVRNDIRVISNNPQTQNPSPQNKDNSSSKNENSFTLEPKYDGADLQEMSVQCSCGNNTRIVFQKEDISMDENSSEELIDQSINEEENLSEEG